MSSFEEGNHTIRSLLISPLAGAAFATAGAYICTCVLADNVPVSSGVSYSTLSAFAEAGYDNFNGSLAMISAGFGAAAAALTSRLKTGVVVAASVAAAVSFSQGLQPGQIWAPFQNPQDLVAFAVAAVCGGAIGMGGNLLFSMRQDRNTAQRSKNAPVVRGPAPRRDP
ncbi:MAG: hypothetical protein KGI37_03190 [Alphaproteobacteria bacterium]|nr:hypothetical protein [Alphaproteobacteria bacterium]